MRRAHAQALMKARHDHHVLLDVDGISCPAAAAAFGFRPLPAQPRPGKGLVGFGIVSDPSVGEKIFDDMPKLEAGSVGALHLFPLEQARQLPDVIVIEDAIESLMWIVLAPLHATFTLRG
jgi:uncharacterized protein (DUF169 family)